MDLKGDMKADQSVQHDYLDRLSPVPEAVLIGRKGD
jgi:hypothetical protein